MRTFFVYNLLWLSVACQGLQINFDRQAMPRDGIRSPCGVLTCSEQNGPTTNTAKITNGDTLHPVTLPPPNSETILSMSVFKAVQNETSGGGRDNGKSDGRLLMANVSTTQGEVHYKSDSLKVDGALTEEQASLRLEMYDQEDCDARFEVEVITVDRQERQFVSIAQTALHQNYESEKPFIFTDEPSLKSDGIESGISDKETMKEFSEMLKQLLIGQERLQIRYDRLEGKFDESEKQLEDEFNSLRREVINFEQRLDSKVGDLDKKMTSVAQELTNVKADPNQMQDISDSIVWLSDEIPTLKKDLSSNLVSIKESLDNNINSVERSLTNQGSSLNDTLVKLEARFATDLKTCTDDVGHALTTSIGLLSAQWASFHERFTTFEGNLSQSLDSLNQSCQQELLEVSGSIKDEISVSEQRISLQLNSTTSTIWDGISIFEDNILRLVASVNDSVTEAISISGQQAVGEIVALKNDFIAEISEINLRFDNKLTLFNYSLYRGLQSMGEAMVSEIRLVGESINNNMSSLESSLSSTMPSANDSFISKVFSVEQTLENLNVLIGQNLTNFVQGLAQYIEEYGLNFKESISATEVRLKEQIVSFADEFSDIKELLGSGTVCDNSSFIKEIASIERARNTQTVSIIDALSDKISTVEERLMKFTLSIRKDLGHDITASEESLRDEFIHLNNSLADGLAYCEENVNNGISRVEDVIKGGLTSTTQILYSHVASVNQTFVESLIAVEQRLKDYIEQVGVTAEVASLNTTSLPTDISTTVVASEIIANSSEIITTVPTIPDNAITGTTISASVDTTTFDGANSITIDIPATSAIDSGDSTTMGNIGAFDRTDTMNINNSNSTTIDNTDTTAIASTDTTAIGSTDTTAIASTDTTTIGKISTSATDSFDTTAFNSAGGSSFNSVSTKDTTTTTVNDITTTPTHIIYNVIFKMCTKNMNVTSTKATNPYAIVLPSEEQIDKPFLCDTETDNGGWIVIQTRKHKTHSFNRGWEDYKRGFGSLTGDFWLGLDIVHNLTKSGVYELRLEFDDYYAHYQSFWVGSEDQNYQLHVGSYDGTSGDILSVVNGMDFSTRDRDNDRSSTHHCAQEMGVAWWYNDCGRYTWSDITRGMILSPTHLAPEIKMRLVDGH